MTVTDNKEKYLLAYGSLRKGQYNFNRISNLFSSKDVIQYVRTIKLPGYKMYSLGSYPACIHTGTRSDIIECDILRMHNSAFDIIDRMEVGAGYTQYSTPIVFKDGFIQYNKDMSIYIFEDIDEETMKTKFQGEVIDGNWVKHLRLLVN